MQPVSSTKKMLGSGHISIVIAEHGFISLVKTLQQEDLTRDFLTCLLICEQTLKYNRTAAIYRNPESFW
jgi:hypothetical protein